MTNDQPKAHFDLAIRTVRFSKEIIDYCRSLRPVITVTPLIKQLIRSATSVGANYCEADEAESKKDFIHKLAIAKKEIRETKYWLELLAYSCPDSINKTRQLYREADELNRIFAVIIIKTQRNINGNSSE
jgi:four helix bundle protein